MTQTIKNQPDERPTNYSSDPTNKTNKIAPSWEEERPSNNFILTASGHKIYMDAINPSSKFDIYDIAISLSRQARFLGHTSYPYSVALHSVNLLRVARLIFPAESINFYLHCLMHDAAEAYLGDTITPIKRELLEVLRLAEEWIGQHTPNGNLQDSTLQDRLRIMRTVETRIYGDICRAFRLQPLEDYEQQVLHNLDSELCVSESNHLCAIPIQGARLTPEVEAVIRWNAEPNEAQALFMQEFVELIHFG